jgi:hypothetical protein
LLLGVFLQIVHIVPPEVVECLVEVVRVAAGTLPTEGVIVVLTELRIVYTRSVGLAPRVILRERLLTSTLFKFEPIVPAVLVLTAAAGDLICKILILHRQTCLLHQSILLFQELS